MVSLTVVFVWLSHADSLLLTSPLHRSQYFHAIFPTHVIVRNKAHLLMVDSCGQNFLFAQFAAELSGIHSGAHNAEYQNVGSDLLRVNSDALNVRQAFSQQLRVV